MLQIDQPTSMESDETTRDRLVLRLKVNMHRGVVRGSQL